MFYDIKSLRCCQLLRLSIDICILGFLHAGSCDLCMTAWSEIIMNQVGQERRLKVRAQRIFL